jgi:hypothetical protein
VNAAAGAAEMVPDIVIPEITETAIRNEVFMPLVARLDKTGPGEVFTVPTAGALSFAQLGSQTYIDGTAPDETAFNTGGRTFTPIFYFCDIVIPMDVIKAAALSVQDAVIKEVGVGLAKHRDSLFAAIHGEAPTSTPDHNVGTDAVALAYSNMTENTRLMYTQNAPRPFSWVVHPIQWGELMADNTFIDAATAGRPGLTLKQGDNGKITDVFDTGIYVSDQIAESSGLHSLMFSTGRAFGYCFKRLDSPISGGSNELMVDIDWNSVRRSYEVNCTYQAAAGGLKGTSTTTNNWVIDCIS